MKFSNFLAEFLDFAPRNADGSIPITGKIQTAAGMRLDVEELALFSVIDLLASAGSICEWRTYQQGTRRRGNDWYLWNVAPNPNQNAAEFKRLLLAQLLRFNEALVFRRKGYYYLADSFFRESYAFRPNLYRDITVGDMQLRYSLEEDDVCYYRLADQNAAAMLSRLRNLYSEAIEEAMDKYRHSGGRSGILHISAQASGKSTYEADLDKLMNERFAKFFKSKNAVLPLTSGFEYVPQDGPASQKSQSEITDIENIFRQAQDRACNAYHVPPAILRGEVTNLAEAINSMLSFGLKPALSVIETENNRKVYGEDVLNGWQMRIDTTHIKTVDVFSAAEKVDKLVQDSVFNVNEIREKLGDDPIQDDWANAYRQTKNMESVNLGKEVNENADQT